MNERAVRTVAAVGGSDGARAREERRDGGRIDGEDTGLKERDGGTGEPS